MNSITKMVLAAFTLSILSLPGYADTVTETTTTVTTIRTTAPIYTGPVQVTELQELTLEDFKELNASKPMVANDAFQKYQIELKEAIPNETLVLYKMKISDRDLVLADFQGVNVSPELAQARYQEYLRLNPITIDGRNVRFVYVYHTPIGF